MYRRLGAALIILLLFFNLTPGDKEWQVLAEPLPEETRALLEKSLSIVEIDREVARIHELKAATQDAIKHSEGQLVEQEIAIAVQKEKAGRVMRSYYMGYNDFWLSTLLSVNSLPDLLRVWDMMDLILQSDKQTMEHYTQEFQQLSKGYLKLQQDKVELAAVEAQLISQRERITALQAELDQALSTSPDEQMLLRLMNEIQAYWKSVGLYEVKQHFRALAEAMSHLPDFIQKTPGIIQAKGLKTKLTITDDQLNEFLRSRDQRFNHFAFTFNDGLLKMEGDNGNMSVTIEGRYSIEEEPENAIRFHVDSLIFNGLTLPDTTREDLEREFDLGFYPQKLIKYVKAESVSMEDGSLIVQLRIGN